MQVVKGQQDLAVVLEVGAEGEKPQEVGLVVEVHGEGNLTAVQHAGVHEGGESIDLVADFVFAFVPSGEGDAVSLTGDVWVIVWGSSWKRSHLHWGPSYASSLPQVIPHVLQSLAQNSLLSCCTGAQLQPL